jgi:peroxiredoxin
MAWGRSRKLAEEGQKAPEFVLNRLGGGSVSLQEVAASGPALLAFFKVSCPVCQFTLPYLDRIHSPGRLTVYGISQNGEAETRKFNEHFGVTFPTLLDSEDNRFQTSDAYGISSVPTLFLVETDGTISRVTEGWQKSAIVHLAGLSGSNPFQGSDHVPEWKAG